MSELDRRTVAWGSLGSVVPEGGPVLVLPEQGDVVAGSAYGDPGAPVVGTLVLPEPGRVAFGEAYGDPEAPLVGLADFQPLPVTGSSEDAVAAVVSWLGAAGNPVVEIVARLDIRADRLPDGHDGTRPGVVVTRMGGGPSGDLDGDEAMLSLRVYGDGTRAGVSEVVQAVVARLHRVSNQETGAGRIVGCVVGSVSDSVDGDMADGAVPVSVVMVEVVVGG